MIPESKLTEWKRLEEQATPAPWMSRGVGGGRDAIVVRVASDTGTVDEQRGLMEFASQDGRPNASNDGEFIAASRTAVPELIAEVERLRAVILASADELERLKPRKDYRPDHGGQSMNDCADLEKARLVLHHADDLLARIRGDLANAIQAVSDATREVEVALVPPDVEPGSKSCVECERLKRGLREISLMWYSWSSVTAAAPIGVDQVVGAGAGEFVHSGVRSKCDVVHHAT